MLVTLNEMQAGVNERDKMLQGYQAEIDRRDVLLAQMHDKIIRITDDQKYECPPENELDQYRNEVQSLSSEMQELRQSVVEATRRLSESERQRNEAVARQQQATSQTEDLLRQQRLSEEAGAQARAASQLEATRLRQELNAALRSLAELGETHANLRQEMAARQAEFQLAAAVLRRPWSRLGAALRLVPKAPRLQARPDLGVRGSDSISTPSNQRQEAKDRDHEADSVQQ